MFFSQSWVHPQLGKKSLGKIILPHSETLLLVLNVFLMTEIYITPLQFLKISSVYVSFLWITAFRGKLKSQCVRAHAHMCRESEMVDVFISIV